MKERDPKGLSKLFRKAIGIGVAGGSTVVGFACSGPAGSGIGAKIGKALGEFVVDGIDKIFKVSHNNCLEILLQKHFVF